MDDSWSSDISWDLSSMVGPQDNGTYVAPAAAQPYNQPWDSGGGSTGNYGGDVLGILTQGIGAWSQYQQNKDFLDYKRFEATNGGLFTQGQAAPGLVLNGQKTSSFGMLLVIGVIAFIALRS